MDSFITLKEIDAAADYIRGWIRVTPKVGLTLGSGLGSLAEMVQNPVIIPYQDIPVGLFPRFWGMLGALLLAACLA